MFIKMIMHMLNSFQTSWFSFPLQVLLLWPIYLLNLHLYWGLVLDPFNILVVLFDFRQPFGLRTTGFQISMILLISFWNSHHYHLQEFSVIFSAKLIKRIQNFIVNILITFFNNINLPKPYNSPNLCFFEITLDISSLLSLLLVPIWDDSECFFDAYAFKKMTMNLLFDISIPCNGSLYQCWFIKPIWNLAVGMRVIIW